MTAIMMVESIGHKVGHDKADVKQDCEYGTLASHCYRHDCSQKLAA